MSAPPPPRSAAAGPATAAAILLALGGGVAIGAGSGFVVPGLLLGIAASLFAARHPFPVLLVLWFATAVVPHGLAADLALRVQVGSVPLHPLDLLFWWCVGVWVVGRLRRPTPPADLATSRLLLPLLTMGAVVAVSLLVGTLRSNAPWDILRDLRGAAFYLLLPIAYLELRDEGRIHRAVAVLFAGALVFASGVLVLALLGDDAWLKADLLRYWLGRPRIYFHNDYVFVLALPLAAAAFLRAGSRLGRLALLAAMALMGLAVSLSLTRSLLVTTLAATGLTAVLVTLYALPAAERTRRLLVLASGGAVAVAAGLAFLLTSASAARTSVHLDDLQGRFTSLSTAQGDSSLRGRLTSYRFALEDASQAPVLGLGFGTLMRIPWAKERRRAVRTEGHQPAVDSAPLTLLAKTGVIGVSVALWFLSVLLSVQWRAMRWGVDGRTRALAGALFAGTVGLAAVSLLQAMLLTSRFIVLFALVCAVSDRLPLEAPGPSGARETA